MRESESTGPPCAGLTEILGLMFPEPAHFQVSRRPSLLHKPHDYVVLPSLGDPRVVLPADSKLAAKALRHARHPLSPRSRLLTTIACTFLRLGAWRLVPSRIQLSDARAGDTLLDLLDTVFGQCVSIGVFLGPARANRKPVLQILDRDGGLLGIAKVGINSLTRELSRVEGDALDELERRDLNTFVAPRLIFRGPWHGLSVMVQSALPISAQTPSTDPSARHRAMRELAESGTTVHEPLGGSRFSNELRNRLGRLGDGNLVELARRTLDTLDKQADSTVLTFGAWHGDWTPWNMAQAPTNALVWDWERFEEGVPVGFDALHYVFQAQLQSSTEHSALGFALLEHAPAVLESFGIDEGSARRIAICYLICIGTRYLLDRQAETGVRGGVVEEWLRPVLEQFPASRGQQEAKESG